MIAHILYTKNSPMERDVERFVRRLDTLRVQTKLVEADSPEGIRLSELYDLMARPAVALVSNQGTMVEKWQGEMPLAEDVSYLAHS
jgi:hypothetical protein